MTYIGLSPPNTFTKSTSQTFTGNGSTTAFTLQTRVSSPEDLEVFVSNVQQQPTESYTIGSDGVTMTFSEAPPSGTFYVIYRTVAQQAGTDTGASRLGENNTFTGTNTFNAQVDVKSNLIVTSEATSGYDPILKIYRDQSDTPQDNDPLGQLDFAGKNDAGQQVNFFRMRAKIKDASDGSEDGQMVFKVMTNGSNTDRITIEGGQPIQLDGGVDINGGELILDADADTSITADTDDQIDFKVGGTDEMKLTTSGIVINEGGNSRDFRVEGDNKDNLLLVDGSADKVGINTSSPDALLDVEGTTDAEIRITRTTATTASTFNDAGSVLNLVNNVNYENGYNGGASIGQILFTSNDSSTGTGVRAKISCKATTYYHAEDLQFFVSPSNTGTGQVSATSQTDGLRMNISSTGKTSIFTDQNSNGGLLQNANSSPYGQSINFSGASPNNTTNWFLSCADTSAQNCIIFSSGTVKNSTGTFTSFSDERLKSDIVDAKSQWEDIKALKFKNFIKFDNPDFKQLGLVAQDVEKTSPNLVFETPPNKFEIKHNSAFGTLYKDGDELPEGKEVGDVKEVKSNVKNVKDSILYMKSVKALQEAMARIETLEAKVKVLEEA